MIDILVTLALASTLGADGQSVEASIPGFSLTTSWGWAFETLDITSYYQGGDTGTAFVCVAAIDQYGESTYRACTSSNVPGSVDESHFNFPRDTLYCSSSLYIKATTNIGDSIAVTSTRAVPVNDPVRCTRAVQ